MLDDRLMTDSFVTDAVLIERAVSCWHLRKLLWQIIHNTWIVGCQIYS